MAEVVETVDEYLGNCVDCVDCVDCVICVIFVAFVVCCVVFWGACDVFIFPPLFLKMCTK